MRDLEENSAITGETSSFADVTKERLKCSVADFILFTTLDMKRKVCTKTARRSGPGVETGLKGAEPRLAPGDLEPPATCALL